MKSRKFIGAFLASLFIFFACKKERSAELGGLPGAPEEMWEFTEAGTVKDGLMDSAYVQSVGSVNTISMVGTSAELTGELFLQVVASEIASGSYTNPNVFFQYAEGGTVLLQSSPVQTGAFSITITSIDSTSVTGTFSGTVVDSQGGEHTISDGRFKSVITSWDNIPPPPQNGQLTVWTSKLCNNTEPIEIRIETQSATITAAMANEPACAAPGTAVFELPVGNYTIEAICGADTLRYPVIVADACAVVEIDPFDEVITGDYLPLSVGSYWEYEDLNDATRSQRITVDGVEEFDSRMFTRFVSTLGDTFYYRKSANEYFERRTFNFQDAVQDPPTIETAILYDNLNPGDLWQTPSEFLNYSGVPVYAKLQFSIVERDAVMSFFGVEYPESIRVLTQLMLSPNDMFYQEAGSYNTVFARGKGIIYYYDVDRDTEWALKNAVIIPE